MNMIKFKEAEAKFLAQYPGGFDNPEIVAIAKKHKMDKMCKMAQTSFAVEQFEYAESIVEAMNKIISQSSLISIFEKPKFRDAVKIMSTDEKEILAKSLYDLLHGDEEAGFTMMVRLLSEYQIAKWPIITVIPAYFRPFTEVFIKPTTTKGVINYFELEGLVYSPKPTYSFYRKYRDVINQMKKDVNISLQIGKCRILRISNDVAIVRNIKKGGKKYYDK